MTTNSCITRWGWRLRFDLRLRVMVALDRLAEKLIAGYERDMRLVAPDQEPERIRVSFIAPKVRVVCAGNCGRLVTTTVPGVAHKCLECLLRDAGAR
jgi:hypothetical protein